MRILVRPGLARLALFAVMAPGARVGTALAARTLGPAAVTSAMMTTLNPGPTVSGATRGRPGPARGPRPVRLARGATDDRARDATRLVSGSEILALPGTLGISTNPQKIWSR
jgi:hypothetical protein